jgi:glycosyltransferase involved in cell wall biosynthesis
VLVNCEVGVKEQRKFIMAKSGYSTGLTLGPIRILSSWWAGGSPSSRKANIFHATYYRPNILERQPGEKLVSTVHDFIPEKLGWTGLRNPHIGKHALLKKSSLIVCVSRSTAEDLQEYFGISGERVLVVPHGVDVDANLESKDISELGDKPRILYVGHRAGYKNFEILLAALQILKKTDEFHLVTAGPPLTGEEIRSMNLAIGESNWSEVKNPSEKQLSNLYREAAVHCVTSSMEGFGMTILESMAQGTPVIASAINVFQEICGESGLFFEDRNPESLAAQIRNVLYKADYKLLSSRALERAAEFSWEMSARELASGYSRIT